MKITAISFLCFISIHSYADTEKNMVPFVFDSVKILDAKQAAKYIDPRGTVMMANKGDGALVNTTSSTQVEASKIGELVSSVRNEVCKGIKKGTFKVWLKFDANAKVLGIGTSSEGGIEVNVECS